MTFPIVYLWFIFGANNKFLFVVFFQSPLPFKWLAIESISDQVFSTYSDVWAFGVVLWEFFTLSKVPYPGMNADQILFNKLQNGYRMEKPQYANQEMYEIDDDDGFIWFEQHLTQLVFLFP